MDQAAQLEIKAMARPSGFVIERVERGLAPVGDNTWPSAWYWLRRKGT